MEELLGKLSDKEKETLRLIVRGHDAKTAARELGLSVHTINERLRSARRKLDVTSSREAARLLFEHEQTADKKSVSKDLGDACSDHIGDCSTITHRPLSRALLIGGNMMILSLIALALATQPNQTVHSEERVAMRERHCDGELSAWLKTLIAAAKISPSGEVVLAHPLSDQQFLQPKGGRYWQISAKGQADFTSRSLWDRALSADWTNASAQENFFSSSEFDDEPLRKVNRIVQLPGSETGWLFMVAKTCSPNSTTQTSLKSQPVG